ncbi:Uncharacterised protein [uncultured archaeon]|nr:Uncharacterised protein [uncultured archaeon]
MKVASQGPTVGLRGWRCEGPARVFKLMSILQETDHQVVLIEHDPLLYDGAAEMVEDVSRAIGEAAKKAAVLLYSQETDPFFEDLIKNADRAFYFEQGPRSPLRMVSRAHPRTQRSQRKLQA